MRIRSAMQKNFGVISDVKKPRSTFNRSRTYKTTFDAGYLIPFFVDEILPGDSMRVNTTFFARLATPIAPIMDNMYLKTYFFFIPNRLLQDNWMRLMGHQDNPADSIDYLTPVLDHTKVPLSTTGFVEHSLSDYLTIPTKIAGKSGICSFWHRGYNLVFNWDFRDENLQDLVVVDKGDGPDDPADYVLLKANKPFDYFTSCLPAAQKWDPVTMPLGDYAEIYAENMDFDAVDDSANRLNVYNGQGGNLSQLLVNGSAAGNTNVFGGYDGSATGTGRLRADLSTATAADIISLRIAIQTQKLFERDMRGGTRYFENIRSHWGVVESELLYRPEYLGGGSSLVNINPIPQTSESGVTPQGNMAAFGTVSGIGHGFRKSFKEYGIILGLLRVTVDLTYQQGLHRMFSRRERLDFAFPEMAHVGEQAILNQEIYCDASANDVLGFGFNERFIEYRCGMNAITGLFRSNATGTLDFWHSSIEFGSLPALNSSFMEENPPLDRNIVTPTEPHFIFDSRSDVLHSRVLPADGNPGFMDHF